MTTLTKSRDGIYCSKRRSTSTTNTSTCTGGPDEAMPQCVRDPRVGGVPQQPPPAAVFLGVFGVEARELTATHDSAHNGGRLLLRQKILHLEPTLVRGGASLH